MKNLYLLRHAQSEGNKLGLFQGSLDLPLSDEGKKQAIQAVEKLKEYHFEVIYTSPQKRALETATIIADRLGLPLKRDERLREISYGILEGKKHSEVREWEIYQKWLENPLKNPLENAENLFDAQRRFLEFLKELSEERILIVTHGGIVRVALCTVAGIPLNFIWKFSVGNCSLTKLEIKELEPLTGKVKFVNYPLVEKAD